MALWDEIGKRRQDEAAARESGRLPPGQHLTAPGKWPVLHEGPVPRFDRARWDFRIFGLVEEERTLRYDELCSLPQSKVVADIHCVTTWSRFDMIWEGVRTRDLLALVKVKPEARAVVVHAEHGYTANLLLADFLHEKALLAHRVDGADLAPEHGYPLRLCVPHLYFWKSVKWARAIELCPMDRPGYWEERGYHMRGDPFQEERYG